MAGFPALKPAFTVQVIIDSAFGVGSHHRKNNLVVVPMVGGTVKSEADFAPNIDAELVGTGNDYIRFDPDSKHMRLNAHSVIKTKEDTLIYINYKGTWALTPDVEKILGGQAGNLTTPYGDSFTYFDFETGDERYKDLENGVFVSQGHFIAESGKKTVVEYKVSQVIQG